MSGSHGRRMSDSVVAKLSSIVRSHQQRGRVPASAHPCRHLLFRVFSYNSHPDDCEVCYLHMVWVCIFLLISFDEHLFKTQVLSAY